MASFTGTKVKDTYPAILKTTDNAALSGSFKVITDGLGNNSALSLSTAGASVGGTLAVSGAATLSSTLAVTGDVTIADKIVHSGDTNTSIRFLTNDTVTIETNGEERVRVDVNGNLGVGDSDPFIFSGYRNVSAKGGSGGFYHSKNSDATYHGFFGMDSAAGFLKITSFSNHDAVISTNNIERARFDSGGDISFRDSSANEAFYWDASETRLGIGTNSPASSLNIQRSSNSGSGSAFPSIQVSNTLATQGDGSSTFNFSNLNISSGNGAVNMFVTTTYAAGAWEPSGQINIASNHPLIVKTNNTERMRILSSGGLTFNGDTSSANALDDYEEGTFTPSIAFGGASVGVTYSEQAGKYTKIGRQVTIECEIVLTNKGSSTGRVEIGNLPFTGIASQFTGAVELRNITFTEKYAITEIGRAAGTFFRVILMDSASNSSELTDTGVANNSAFFFSATYFV